MKKKVILDLGCGHDKLPTQKGEKVIGVDYIKTPKVDVVHNLEKPLPFSNGFADKIYSNHTLEHVENAKGLIEEIWRVAKSNSEIFIRVPHHSSTSAFTDLTHKTFFSSRSFDYYVKGAPLNEMSGYEGKVRFKMLKKHIVFNPPYKIIEALVNINEQTRKIYEFFFCWIFPARDLEFTLKPEKN